MSKHLLALAIIAPLALATGADAQTKPQHAIAIHGEPKYGPDFKHLDYVNPNAPRGGEVILSAPGTFDTLNPFILRGVAAAGAGSIYTSLMTRIGDDPESNYALVAESIEVPADRSWAIFTMRPEATWHDGKPMTPEDVVWTFDTLMTKGTPRYRSYYGDVAKADALDERRVKFTFRVANNKELPGIISEMPILPKHYWKDRDFEKTTLEPPLGSGAYRIEAVEAARSVRLRRVENWWGDKLPLNVGRHNFGVIRYEYYRDGSVAFEAFKAGAFDFRLENQLKDWATGYDIPQVKSGLIKREVFKTQNPARAQGFVFNTRRPLFQDRRVREALGYAFDFEWMNKTLWYELVSKPESYWPNSELGSRGLPEGEEKEILERYRGRIPDEVFTKPFATPTTDGSGNLRDNVRAGLRLLGQAGWTIKNGKLTNAKGEIFQFEILSAQPGIDRLVLPYVKNLERFGITASLRIIDSAQYSNRADDFDYDMVVGVPAQSSNPGNEQREYWGSAAAATRGSNNTPGIKDPVVDELIELVIAAPDRNSLVQRTRALDRVLLWGFYMVPQLYTPGSFLAYWDKFGRPDKAPTYALGFADTWWVDPAKASSLEQRKSTMKN